MVRDRRSGLGPRSRHSERSGSTGEGRGLRRRVEAGRRTRPRWNGLFRGLESSRRAGRGRLRPIARVRARRPRSRRPRPGSSPDRVRPPRAQPCGPPSRVPGAGPARSGCRPARSDRARAAHGRGPRSGAAPCPFSIAGRAIWQIGHLPGQPERTPGSIGQKYWCRPTPCRSRRREPMGRSSGPSRSGARPIGRRSGTPRPGRRGIASGPARPGGARPAIATDSASRSAFPPSLRRGSGNRRSLLGLGVHRVFPVHEQLVILLPEDQDRVDPDDQETDDRAFLGLDQGQSDAEGPDPRVGRIGEDLEADRPLTRLADGCSTTWTRGEVGSTMPVGCPSFQVAIKASMACRPLAESGTIGIGSVGASQPEKPVTTKATKTHQDRREVRSTRRESGQACGSALVRSRSPACAIGGSGVDLSRAKGAKLRPTNSLRPIVALLILASTESG